MSVASSRARPASGPPQPFARRWPWVVALASLGLFVAANVLYPSDDADLIWTVMFTGILAAFVLVGAIITTRVPGNAVGPVLLLSGALLASTIAIGTLSIVGATAGTMSPELVALTGHLNDLGFTLPIIVVLIGVPLIFPDGRLLSARWRWVVVLAISAYLASAVGQIIGPGPVGGGELENPLAIPALFPLATALDAFANWSSIIGFVAAVTAVVLRYRRGDPVERQQLKWPAVSVALALVFPVAFIVPDGPIADLAFLIGLLALLTLPIFIGIAVTRYRLYEIDRIISRTLSWGVVSGVLAAIFICLVVGLQWLLSPITNGETLIVAASTLVVATLFAPLRSRVQTVVDRRFDRSAYDAARTVEAYAGRLRDELDLGTLTDDLRLVTASAVHPTATGVWLRDRRSIG